MIKWWGLSPSKYSWLFWFAAHCAAATLMLACLILSPVARGAQRLPVDQAVEIALRQSPEIQALGAQSDALDAMVPQAGALPDPVLSLNALNLPTDSFDFDQEPMTNVQLALMQSIPSHLPSQMCMQETGFERTSWIWRSEISCATAPQD